MKRTIFCLRRTIKRTSIFLILIAFCSPVMAELILTAPPRETAAQGLRVYGPLASYLTKVVGETVTYQHPGTWSRYQRDMRADKFDIVFDGPHFMSWRMKKYGHTPLVKLPGNLSFVVISRKEDKKIKTLKDLSNENICTLSPPNLSALIMIMAFGDTEPTNLKIIKGGMDDIVRVFKKGECKAANLRQLDFETMFTEEERNTMNVLYQSEPMSNQGITVSSRVDKELHENIILGILDNVAVIQPILKRFSPGDDIMIPVEPGEYDEYSKLLEGVIIGW